MHKYVLIIIGFIGMALPAQTNWRLKKDINDIKIYTRSLPEKNIDEYKAVTVVNASLQDVVTELITAPEYYEECKSGISYHVSQLQHNQHVFYVRKELPWPVKDRDIITLLTVKKISDSKYKLTLESLPNAIPKKSKTIRIKELMGFWMLEEMKNTTKITQQLFIDPEGTLPTFIINGLLVKGPLKTFSELKASLNNS